MKLNQVFVVYGKEMIDILRDRRTLISMILIPLLIFPLMTIGFGSLMGTQVKKMEKKTYSVALIGAENAPELFAFLQADSSIKVFSYVENVEQTRQLIKNKIASAVINVPKDFETQLKSFFLRDTPAPSLEVLADESKMESEIVSKKLTNLISEYRQNTVSKELKRLNLRDDLTKPFTVKSINLASEEEMGGFVAGMILPYMVIILALVGAMYPAIDLTAGEKERGTLETLLVAPVGRMEMVLGKFLTIMTSSLVTAVLAIISLYTTFIIGTAAIPEEAIKMSLDVLKVLGILLIMLPIAMLFSALLMTLALFARSYREAQSYISPLMIVVILPAMISMIPGVEPSFKLAITPICNVALMLKETLTGNFNFALIAVTFVSSSVYAAIGILIAFRQFQRESVLFRV
jgi:sodium transport system permease protein